LLIGESPVSRADDAPCIQQINANIIHALNIVNYLRKNALALVNIVRYAEQITDPHHFIEIFPKEMLLNLL